MWTHGLRESTKIGIKYISLGISEGATLISGEGMPDGINTGFFREADRLC